MNFAGMSKEQKQYMFLGALVGAIAIYSVFNFVLVPMKSNWSEARLEVDELQTNVDRGERLISGRAKMAANLEESEATMQAAMGSHMPDTGNPLAWATATLYAVGRDVGLDIRSVSEAGPPAILVGQAEKGDRRFGAYAVRVESECSFALLKDFLRALEASNPYVCVSGITIDGKAAQPQRHGVNLVVEWPSWVESAVPSAAPGPKGV